MINKARTQAMAGPIIFGAFVGMVAAQEGVKKHPVQLIPASHAPVTQAEARATFVRADAILKRVLHLAKAPPAVGIPERSAPVSREEVVAEFARMYDYVRPKITLTPVAVRYDPAVLRIAGSQSANLNRFIRMGAIARVGPLATGPTDYLTVPQFGDALGFFLARIAELTHMPSNKWTPELTPPASMH